MTVAVYFATGFEEVEALAVVDILRRGAIDTKMVGIDHNVVTSARGVSVQMDTTLDKLDIETIDMMVLPGGIPGIINLENSSKLMNQLVEAKAKNKWLAAICAAPSILGKQGLLKGEKATCYPNYESALMGCEVIDEPVVVSNHIITGKGASFAIQFALKILEELKGSEIAREVAKSILFSA